MLAVAAGDSPVGASVSRVAAAPVAVAVATKIGPRNTRLRAQTGTAVVARSTPVYEPREAPTTADAAPSARAARRRPATSAATAAPMTLPNAVRHQVPIDIGERGLTIRSMATKRLDRPRSDISSPEVLELFAAGAHVGGEHQSKVERAFVSTLFPTRAVFQG